MPALTRRPHSERSDCWHVYYGYIQVGTIVGLADIRQAMEMGLRILSTRPSRKVAFRLRGNFRTSAGRLRNCLEGLSPAMLGTRLHKSSACQRAWTAWKYAMREDGLPLQRITVSWPTQKISPLPLNFFLV